MGPPGGYPQPYGHLRGPSRMIGLSPPAGCSGWTRGAAVCASGTGMFWDVRISRISAVMVPVRGLTCVLKAQAAICKAQGSRVKKTQLARNWHLDLDLHCDASQGHVKPTMTFSRQPSMSASSNSGELGACMNPGRRSVQMESLQGIHARPNPGSTQ